MLSAPQIILDTIKAHGTCPSYASDMHVTIEKLGVGLASMFDHVHTVLRTRFKRGEGLAIVEGNIGPDGTYVLRDKIFWRGGESVEIVDADGISTTKQLWEILAWPHNMIHKLLFGRFVSALSEASSGYYEVVDQAVIDDKEHYVLQAELVGINTTLWIRAEDYVIRRWKFGLLVPAVACYEFERAEFNVDVADEDFETF